MNKIILWLLWLIITILLWLGGYHLFSNNNSWIVITETTEVVIDLDLEAKEIMLNDEIKLKLEFLNKALRPNYLKISWFDKTKSLAWFTDEDPNVEFYKISIEFEINDDTLADFDVLINKWSVSHADFKSKWELYKQNIERIMRNTYYVAYWYDRLIQSWIVWYIEYTWNNIYHMYEMWDYIKSRFWDSTINVDTLVKLSILEEYFNYWDIFFNKDPADFLKILNEVTRELNDPQFNQLSRILQVIYFKDLM
jgi:hypothetical protein